MEERTLQFILMGTLMVTVLVFAWTGVSANTLAEKAVPRIFTPIYCSEINGSLSLARPTDSEYCSTLKGDSPDARFCEFYPAEKRDACRKLLQGIVDRKWDCLSFTFTNETKFEKGSPVIQEACRELLKE